jgi:hypothetical protein
MAKHIQAVASSVSHGKIPLVGQRLLSKDYKLNRHDEKGNEMAETITSPPEYAYAS